jgi:holo-[acyl-carrier protein] synthase
MKVKCGVDIIEISRIQESIESLGDKFLNKVYTKKEIEYCESKGKTKYEHYAARFAVKEAAFKAVSEGVKDKFAITWKDIETVNDENGRPKTEILFLKNSKIENVDVSISHCKDYAVANVTVLFK